jgi:hypothetical protein
MPRNPEKPSPARITVLCLGRKIRVLNRMMFGAGVLVSREVVKESPSKSIMIPLASLPSGNFWQGAG